VLTLMIIGFLLIIALEVPSMVAKGQTGELRTFWVLLVMGFALSLAIAQNWPVPNPTRIVEAVFNPISVMLGLK
jgi:hypothetical protein